MHYSQPFSVDSNESQSRSHSRARPGRTPADLNLGTNEPKSSNQTSKSASTLHSVLIPASHASQAPDTEFDERGEEMSDTARIWRIYIEQACKADSTLVDGCNRSIDALLVFTGLFSAVLTTFVIQSYQLMIPDAADTTNALLAQLISLQANPSEVQARTSSPASADAATSMRQLRWVNGLWFAALSCSLSTALISMLAKQWLQAYLPNTSGSPRHRARQRQFRYMQLEAWHVLAIINALPLLLHVALLLFFAGIIVLLWSVDIGITIATWVIVALAYTFYFVSILLPLIYPDCPYQHPISDHLQKLISPKASRSETSLRFSRSRRDLESGLRGMQGSPSEKNNQPTLTASAGRRTCAPLSNDVLEATALAWLFTNSTDNDVISAALQAIAGLPREFSAIQILRHAGALDLVICGFQACFNQDTSVGLQWHLIDVGSAELYCRAWIRLTRGTLEQWPLEIVEPLWILQDLKGQPDAAAIASCAVALSSFDSHTSLWELLSYLARYEAGDIQLAHATQCCLLDSIIECAVGWEMPMAVIGTTAAKAVPVLLRMLHLTQGLPISNVRSATTLALYVFTGRFPDLAEYQPEARRREDYCELSLVALAEIVRNPNRFDVRDSLLDIAAQELARLASPIIARSERFPRALRDVARKSLSQLYIDSQIGVETLPDAVLADVLQLLFPPTKVSLSQRPLFVTTIVKTLWASSHPGVTSWSVRLLEVLLLKCSAPVSRAFVDGNGIKAVLRAAKTGDIDSRRLQIDSLRTLCAFIDSSTSLYSQQSTATPPSEFDHIFQSDFFEILCSLVSSRKWWLFEISGHWMPALIQLCRIRPGESIWRTVAKVIRDFAERNVGEEGYTETLSHVDAMVKLNQDAGPQPQ